LYSPQGRGFINGTDPCTVAANPTPAQQQLCIAQGVPAADLPTFTQASTGFERTAGGNPNLYEEKSETFTIGAVMQIPGVNGLNVAVDYFTVEVEDAIATISADATLVDCFTRLDQTASSCQAIVRLPNGQIEDIRATSQNIGLIKARGLDLQVDYRFSVPWGISGNDGQIALTMLSSWLFERSMEITAAQGSIDCAGFMGGGCGGGTGAILIPDLKLRLSSNYRSGPLSLSLHGRMINRFDLRPGLSAAVSESPRQWYMDANASFEVGKHLQITAGVDNLFDRQPPILGTALAGDANTDVGVYDVLGRRYFIGLQVKF